MSSVAFLDFRPPPAPPPEPPSPPAPPDPPDLQICFCLGESLPRLPFSTSFRVLDSLLQLSSARSGFDSPASLPLLPTKALVSIVWIGELGARLCPAKTLFRQVGYLADAPTFPPQTLPQVCSCSTSPSNSTEMGLYWILTEFVALVWWLSDLVHRVSMSLDTLVSSFVLLSSTHFALVRSITAVCRVCLNVVLLEVVLLQLGQGSLFQYNRLVNLAHWGCYCPHFSFTELFILPCTSLVFSDSVTGSNVFKTVLLEVEAKTVDQDSFRSTLVGCLALYVAKGFVPFFSIGIYDYVGVVWEVQSLFRASLPHLGTCCQFLFPKFPLVWSGLDDQVSPVLQGSSSRLMVSSALVAELVALWVALDAVTHEAVGIVFFRSLLVFMLELYFQSISISSLTFFRWTFKLLLLCYLVLPPLLIEFEA